MSANGRARGVRRHATTLVLVALTLAAGMWVMVAERRLPSTAELEARRESLVPTWDAGALRRVDVVSLRGGAFAIVLEPGTDDGAPAAHLVRGDERLAADAREVDAWLTGLEHARVVRHVAEESVDRAAMGLDAPAARVTITMGETTHRLALGGSAPGGGRYVAIEGRRVAVVPDALATTLQIDVESLRERALVPHAPRAIARWSLEGEGGTRRLVRGGWPASGADAFRFEGGPRLAAGPGDALLEAVTGLRADAFPPGEAGPIEEPRLAVAVQPTVGEARTLLHVGGACPDRDDLVLVHRVEPTPLRACIERAVVPPLLRPRHDLEDTRLVAATRDEIVEVRVVEGDAVLEMARRGAGFHVRKPSPRDVPEAAARALLDALTGARGTIERGDAAAVDREGSATIEVVSRPAAPGDPERTEVLRVGPSRDGRRRVHRDEDGVTLLVDDAAVRALLAPELILRDRQILDVDPDAVRAIAVDGPVVDQEIRRDGAGVALVAPRGPGLTADDAWALDLIDRVARLEAVRWVATAPGPSFGLDPARITLEVDVAPSGGEAQRRTVRLGVATDDGPFAQIDGDPTVFIAPAALEEAATRWLVDRGAFRVRPGDAETVTLRAGDAPPLELRRVEGALLPRTDAPDAAARAARAREGLDELSAIEAVAIGRGRPEHGLDEPVLAIEVTPRDGSPFRIDVGASDARAGESLHYARRSDVGAVFTVGRAPVRALLEAVR